MHLFFHIGSPKAGSTTIQSALRRNAPALARQGVLAWEPSSGRSPPARVLANAFVSANKPLLPRERLHFNDRAAATAWSLENWDRLEALVAETKPELTILSSESFFDMPGARRVAEKLRSIFDGVTIFAYVRDPVSQYRSMLDQRIRDGERFAELPSPSVMVQLGFDVIARYRAQLGQENVIVRSFDRSNLAGGDLLTDFFGHVSTVLGRPLDVDPRVPPANESLCAAATLWLMGANEVFIRFGKNDSEVIERRLELIRRLGVDPDLAALSKLRDPVGPIADWVRHANREAITYFNTVMLQGQVPLQQAPEGVTVPDEEEVRAAMRAWLLSHLKDDELSLVLQRTVT
ncbi:MAG: hypothetical protein KDK12_06080 [Rhodobacteraceae bacterium]|nr:hypothetical protein [Paracoccaceae bacterium]